MLLITQEAKSRDGAVGIATRYGLDNRGVGVHSPFMVKNFLPHVLQTGSGAHQASYSMGTGGSFPGAKRQGREADYSPTTRAEVNKPYIYIFKIYIYIYIYLKYVSKSGFCPRLQMEPTQLGPICLTIICLRRQGLALSIESN
jgi:hypothetical protein